MDSGRCQLRELFKLTSELRAHARDLVQASRGERARIVARQASVRARLEDALADEARRPAVLQGLVTRFALEPQHLVIMLLLLLYRMENGPCFNPGRSILMILSAEPWHMLEGSPLLGHESPLIEQEIVRRRGIITDSPPEAEYRIAEWVYDLVAHSARGSTKEEQPRPRPYLSSSAHLMDLKQLVELYQIRAAGLFDDSGWRDCYPEADTIAEDISPLILEVRSAITQREARQGQDVTLPVVALRNEHTLQDEEEIMVLALLFHELFAGPPLLDAGELVRLVSQSEEDVFRKRRLISRGSRLRDGGLVLVESEIEGKDLVGETYLAGWVEERLLEGIDAGTAIDADECKSFHRYLERLRDSDDFYRNL